jgi:hypothetical protein
MERKPVKEFGMDKTMPQEPGLVDGHIPWAGKK